MSVIVSISAGHVTTKTLESDVGPHPHFSGSQEGGGEKKYEERHSHEVDGFYDDVIRQCGEPDALLLFGPGEAKLQLKDRLGRSNAERIVAVESADKLTGSADCGESEGTLRNRSLSDAAPMRDSNDRWAVRFP